MNKSWFYLGVVGSLLLLVTSCGDSGSNPPTPTASPSTVASPVAVVPVATPTPIVTTKTVKTVVVTTKPAPPVVAATNQKLAVDAGGLIAVTNADNWTKTVAKGRPDPFGALSLQAMVVVDKNAPIERVVTNSAPPTTKTAIVTPTQKTIFKTVSVGEKPIKSGSNKPLPKIKVTKIAAIQPAGTISGDDTVDVSTPTTKTRRAPAKIAPKPKVTIVAIKPASTAKPAAKAPKTTVALKPVPQPYPTNPNSTPPTTAPDAPPAPALAPTIGVSGVIEVGGKTQVIVKLPNESFSRYVEVGERISNGKVTVKRIEGEQTLAPIVILEESGVEFARKVGDLGSEVTKEANNKETSK